VTTWHSLYLRSDDPNAVAEHLRGVLTAFDYTLYDPFGTMPGAAYNQSVKLFVSPTDSGWVRVIGNVDSALLSQISEVALCLSAEFDDNSARVTVFEQGNPVTIDALTQFLRDGVTVEVLQRSLIQPTTQPATNDKDFPMDVLPDDLKDAAKDLNPKHINRMFGKLMKKVNRQLGGSTEGARELLKSDGDWRSVGGQRLRAFMNGLTLPSHWHTPDFVALRDAYQLQRRKQRNPNAPDYPGDAEAMQAVSNALDYLPVYGGK